MNPPSKYATVPIRREAHKRAKMACAKSGQTLIDFVSAAVAAAAAGSKGSKSKFTPTGSNSPTQKQE